MAAEEKHASFTFRLLNESSGAPVPNLVWELLGLGAALLALAVVRSFAREYGGRVGLHSLKDTLTEAFYEKAGMKPLFRDPMEQDELYFEFTEVGATTFLEKALGKA